MTNSKMSFEYFPLRCSSKTPIDQTSIMQVGFSFPPLHRRAFGTTDTEIFCSMHTQITAHIYWQTCALR